MSESLHVTVDLGTEPPVGLSEDEVEQVALGVLRAEGVEEAEISVAFLDDARIAELNRTYLGHDGPTDVISFPLHLPGHPPLGDIYVGASQATRQADEMGIPLAEELLRLTVHGVLHILGYEHPEDDEREDSVMYRRQEALLAELRGDGAAPG